MRGILLLLCCTICLCARGQDVTATVLLNRGRALYDEGKYRLAADTLELATRMFISTNDLRGQIASQQLHGECLANLSQCEPALEILSATLDLSLTHYEIISPEVADSYYYLARATGGCARKWDDGIALMLKSSSLKEKIYGEYAPEVALNHTFMGYMQHNRGQYDSAIHYLTKALEIRKAQVPEDEVEMSNVFFHLGNTWMIKGDLTRALDLELKSLAIREKMLGPDHASLSNTITVIGGIYQRLGNHERALEYYHKGLEIRKRSLGLEHGNVAASYYTIGTLYSNIANYQQAIQYLQQGNRITAKVYGETSDILPTYYAYTGRLYGRIGEHETALIFFRQAEEQAERNLKKDHPYLGLVYSMIAEYYAGNANVDEGFRYANKAVAIFRKVYGEGTAREADVWHKLAGGYLTMGDVDHAIELYERSLTILRKVHGDGKPPLASTYEQIGRALHVSGQPSRSMQYYQKALQCLSAAPEKLNDPYVNPEVADLENKFRALNILVKKVEALAELARDNDDLFKYVLASASLCLALVDEIGFGYNNESERTELEALSRRAYNRLVEAAFVLWSETGREEYLAQGFFASEKSRAAMLLESMRDAGARVLAGVPDSVVELERDLKIMLTWQRNALYQAVRAGKVDETSGLERQVFETEALLDQLKRELKQDFPSYFAYKYASPKADAGQLADSLDAGTGFIEYFVGDSAIYVFMAANGNTTFSNIKKTGELISLIHAYQRSLSDGRLILNFRDSADHLYTHSAAALYDRLLRPFLEGRGLSRLIIVPDDILAQLNFGPFLVEKSESRNPDYRRLHYVLKDYELSYAYAAQVLQGDARSRGRARNHLAAFAPSYPGGSFNDVDPSIHPLTHVVVRDGLLPLPGAQKEVERIAEFMDGDVWVAREATETNFKLHAADYKVLHLAMHSLLNNENPLFSELLFNPESDEANDGYLSVAEIYNLNLHADMVVLSACSSGAGTIQLGEGPITLSRAFSYAGCPSIVMSLWKISDNTTADIMDSFYRELMNGVRKDEALQRAQLKFLEETEDPINHHPYFWAGFVVMGDASRLPSSGPPYFLIAGGFMLVAAGLSLYVLSRRRGRRQKASSKVFAS